MKKRHVACLAAAALVWAVLPGCYEEYGHSHDVQVEDGHQPDVEVYDPLVDPVPDPQEVPPDVPYDVPPDVIYDVPPDYPHDVYPDYPPDYPYDIPPDIIYDVPPDTTCVSEGCVSHGGSICCPGLSQATECDPTTGDPECTMLFCIRCGDGFCSPHETCYNCPEDCSVPPCEPGSGMGYSCSPIETHNCTCTGGDCRPVCQFDSSGVTGWVDPCTGAMIRSDDCRGQSAVCSAICSRSEGWVESDTGELITWALCGNRWSCEVIW